MSRPPPLPLTHIIYQEIRRRGSMTERELFESLRAMHLDVTISEMEKALMKMEIAGLIRVTGRGGRGGFVIELAQARRYLPPDEE
ncbi:MAG: hypothetical protein DRO06_02170 [Thermoproteota archaeon]|nr:MAG: hypothetical protein DRO06_02170 [Candidatus Korarchaeota archaeon]